MDPDTVLDSGFLAADVQRFVSGDVYDTAALTEDNELTLAIKSLGGLMASPSCCRMVSTWSGGWKARLRAVLLIPELLYDIYLDIVYVKGISNHFRSQR